MPEPLSHPANRPPAAGACDGAGRTLGWSTLIALGFCAAIGVTLLAMHLRSQADDPLKAPELSALKQQLSASPQDEALKQRIRSFDLQVRHRYFRQLTLTTTGGYLLLGGLVIGLLAAKRLAARHLRPFLPPPWRGIDPNAAATDPRARWSAGIAGGAVLLGCLALAFGSGTALPDRFGDSLPAGAPANPLLAAPADSAPPAELQRNWPRFRGWDGSGVALETNVPVSWDVKTGAGVLWKVRVPAPGHNSPIVWGDRVFLSGGTRDKREVMCFDAATGALVWQTEVQAPPASAPPAESWEVPEMAGVASPTMATDGRRVYAIFGNGDLAALDFHGQVVWSKALGIPHNPHGHASSLATWRQQLIVLFDQGEAEERRSRLHAFDGATGKVLWQRPRPTGSSWATPLVIEAAGRPQIVTLAVPWAIGYAAPDGTELWRAEVLNGEVTPSPVLANGLVLAVSPNEKLLALRPDGQGDVTPTHVAWSAEENIPDISSPVSNGELVFTLSTPGMLTAWDVRDGRKYWEHDFALDFQASPTLVGDRLYLLGSKGAMVVVAAGKQFTEIARTDMGEGLLASPAVAHGRIFIRGANHLFALGHAGTVLATPRP